MGSITTNCRAGITIKNAEEYKEIYEELIGFTPPKIQHRVRAGLECNPEILEMVENIRTKAMYPDSKDTKTAQMILFGILLSHVAPASEFHARGAMRAGATKQELHDICGLAFLFRGLPAFILGAQVINEVFDDPDKEIGDIFA